MCETPIQRSNKNGMVKILQGRKIKKKKKNQRNFIRELMDSQEV